MAAIATDVYVRLEMKKLLRQHPDWGFETAARHLFMKMPATRFTSLVRDTTLQVDFRNLALMLGDGKKPVPQHVVWHTCIINLIRSCAQGDPELEAWARGENPQPVTAEQMQAELSPK